MSSSSAFTCILSLIAGDTLSDRHRVHGRTALISGDTLILQDQYIHLYEINGRETSQTCRWQHKVIDCSQVARANLVNLIASIDITGDRRQKITHGTLVGFCLAES